MSTSERILTRLLALVEEAGDPQGGLDNLSEAWEWVEEQVEAQEREIQVLKRHLGQYQVLVESLGEGAMVLDEQGRVSFVNPAGRQILGKGGELRGRVLHDLVHPESVCEDPSKCLLYRAFQAGAEIYSAEERFATVEGEVIPVMFTLTRVVGQALDRGAVLVFRDLSDFREMHGQLLAADRLVAVGTLASGLAHEINNPLAYVQSNVRFAWQAMAEEELTDRRREQVQEALEDTLEGVSRIRRIIDGMRTFTGQGSDGRRVDCEEALQGALAICAGALKKFAELERQGPPLEWALADQQLLTQVFVNLLVNASQSIGESIQGRGRVEVRTVVEEEVQKVEVIDDGVGIEEELCRRIFDPFFTTRETGGGIGLGLYMCRTILRNFGGEVTVESEPGNGARFVVTLPRLSEGSG